MARVREIIHAYRRLTIREVAEEVRTAFGTCQKILTEDLRMRRVTAKFVPRLLTAEQKDGIACQFALTSVIDPIKIPASCPR